MRQRSSGFLAFVLLSGLAGPGAAAGLAALDLGRHTQAGFSADLQAGIAGLAAAQTPRALQQARLELAQVYLARLMLPEARSVLAAVVVDQLDSDGAAEWGALNALARLMAGEALEPDTPHSPLAADDPGWPDRPLLAALQAARKNDGEALKAAVPGALARLGAYPRAYAGVCLPLFLQAALDVQAWDLAKTVAEAFDRYPELKAEPVYSYLLGRAAEGVRRRQNAYIAYRQAAVGSGPWAEKAVLALVDLGLEDRSLPLEEARKKLAEGLQDWRGGTMELEILRRLAQVDQKLSDWNALLVTLGRIQQSYPSTKDAEGARAQAESLINAWYPYALSGKVPLTDLLATHRRITPYYRLDPAFETQSEALADHLLKLGATALAAAEYARIHDTLEVVGRAKLWPVAPGRLARLKLGQADALARGGRFAEAAQALARMAPDAPALPGAAAPAADDGLTPADKARRDALQVEIFAALGENDRLAGMPLDNASPRDLRRLAMADESRKDWTAAAAAWNRLWKTAPEDFGSADAIRLLLAAYRAGDHTTAARVQAALPSIGASAGAQSAAAGLLSDPPPVTPLKESAADLRLQQATDAIQRADKALAGK